MIIEDEICKTCSTHREKRNAYRKKIIIKTYR
jgi:hypothetical protein